MEPLAARRAICVFVAQLLQIMKPLWPNAEVVRDTVYLGFFLAPLLPCRGFFFPFAASCEAAYRMGSWYFFRIPAPLSLCETVEECPRISAILAVSKVPCRVFALDPALKRWNEPIKTALATRPSVRSTPPRRAARPGAP